MKSNQKEKGVRERGGAMTVQIKVDRLQVGLMGMRQERKMRQYAIFSDSGTYACGIFHIVALFHLAVHFPPKQCLMDPYMQ